MEATRHIDTSWINPPCRPSRQPFCHLSDEKIEPWVRGGHGGGNWHITELKDAAGKSQKKQKKFQ